MFEKTFEVNGVEFDVEFSATPYVPAKISGPPDNCHEAEGGEVEIESISIGDWEVSDVISDDVKEKLLDKCRDAAPELLADEADCAMADAAEAAAADREASWDY